MKPTIVADSTADSLTIHWLVIEKECPIEVEWPRVEPIMVKPPYYKDEDILLYDHATLVQFLQERYPGEQLLPADPVSRAQIRQACTYVHEPDIDIFAEIEAIMDTGSLYAAGDQFTLLDIYLGVWLHENYRLDNSSVRSYWERISSRPAFRTATS